MEKNPYSPDGPEHGSSPVFLYFFLGIMILSIVFFAGYMIFTS